MWPFGLCERMRKGNFSHNQSSMKHAFRNKARLVILAIPFTNYQKCVKVFGITLFGNVEDTFEYIEISTYFEKINIF